MSSCTEQESAETAKQNPPPVSSKPKKQPVPVPPKPAKGGPPPAAKPKPKPVSNVSQQESGLIQGNQDEIVKSSKSRDFFKQQEQKAKDEVSPTNTMERRTSYSERRNEQISPTNTLSHNPPKKSPVPPPATKPRSMSNSSNSSDKGQENTATQVAAKKLPPPAPPKRSGSLSENSKVTPAAPVGPSIEELVPEEDLSATELSPRMPSFKPPPPPTTDDDAPNYQQSTDVAEDLPLPPANSELPPPPPVATLPEPSEEALPPPPPTSANAEPPAMEPPAVTVLPIQLPGDKDVEVDDGFAETDDIMADIMADIDDFSKQIDSMF